jgi:DNA anti-recombination protein RmuC
MLEDRDDEAPDRVEVTGSLTKDEWERQFAAERDFTKGQIAILAERFRGIDKATELLSATVNRVPTDLQQAESRILRLMDERDRMYQARFDANEKLGSRESDLNQTALTAALNAAKEAAAVVKETLESKIDNQGATTDRTIDKNAELAKQEAAALSARVTQLSDQLASQGLQITGIVSGVSAVKEQRVDTRGGLSNAYGAIGAVLGVLSLMIAIAVVIIGTR